MLLISCPIALPVQNHLIVLPIEAFAWNHHACCYY